MPETGDAQTMLRAERGEVVATATADLVAPDRGDAEALWGALRRHTLSVTGMAGPDDDRRAAFGEVLDLWMRRVTAAEVRGDEDSSCVLRLPSADTALVRPLLARGFAPVTIDAERRLTRPVLTGFDAERRLAPPVLTGLDAERRLAPPVLTGFDAEAAEHDLGEGALLRRAAASDLPALAAFDSRLLLHEAAFGAVSWRDGAEALLRDALARRFRAWSRWTWLVEQGGRSVGYVHAVAEHPDAPDPTSEAYLDAMYLSDDARGSGLGRRVIDTVHALLAADGAVLVRLDYSVANPLSGPFWSRAGYRPSTTTWQRRPAVL
ncbi:GNAT family N-acetyltransferase [Streptomyces sp. AC495_CC817]|uniref:GNAT family N-acetyltransferase n=1 Tax=Streptomyces sp. AC495_CC817 TaxID=2823900 RepID=UPI001C26A7B7|nr:GNAT family N-acetyltransferase [Streptomyces sp. AC495_CC817]